MDAICTQSGQITHLYILPHLLVVGIHKKIRVLSQGAVAPLLQIRIQECGGIYVLWKIAYYEYIKRSYPGGNFPHGNGVEGIGEETSLASYMRYP
jgi:hypothetical protein